MCGRYNLIPDASAWADVGVELGESILQLLQSMSPRYNVAPTTTVPIIVADEVTGEPKLIEARWGLIPSWWKKPTPPPMTTNVRSETAATKPMWRHAWRHQRCLIPASGWYEWFVLEDGSGRPPRVPHHVRQQDGRHILFAGLWSVFRASPDSAGLPTCSIVTIASPPSVARIHARTPVVLKPEFWRPWIDPSIQDPAAVSTMVRDGATRLFSLETLGQGVGNSRNHGEDLVAPVDRPEMDDQRDWTTDDEVLAWLRTTPAAELDQTIRGRLAQTPLPLVRDRRLWVREIEDRDDVDVLSSLLADLRASLASASPKKARTAKPADDPSKGQGGLF